MYLIHGKSHTKLYKVWKGMRQRCLNPNKKNYKNYGGRGITMCKEWLDNFEVFEKWAYESGYSDGLSIDRIDNDGNYEPSNCRWTTPFVQANNRRTCHLLTFNGETHNIREWARIIGVRETVIHQRLKRGWSIEKTLTEPLRNMKGE